MKFFLFSWQIFLYDLTKKETARGNTVSVCAMLTQEAQWRQLSPPTGLQQVKWAKDFSCFMQNHGVNKTNLHVVSYNGGTSRRHSLSANVVIKDHEIRSIPKQGSVNFPRTWKERSIVKETNYQSQALVSMVSFAPAKSAGMPNACDGRSVVPDLDTMCISIAFSYSLNALTT